MTAKLNLDRRRALGLLASAAAAPLGWTQDAPAVPGKRSLLMQNDYPEDLETPVEYFDTWITPNDAFFVRQHLPRPRVDAAQYKLTIEGMVQKNVTLTLAELKALPQHELPATLECAGNGRRNYKPRMPGLQWDKGAMGNARWRGPRLADVLSRAGVDAKATHIDFNGADVGAGTTPDFIRSLPRKKAFDESTIIALQMNGETLPEIHGFPARLIVPGWDGASWVKWVTSITASDKPHPGFFMSTAYKYPKYPTAPGVAPKPEEMESIEGMAVKSFFTSHSGQAKVALSGARLRGFAWGGENRITKVEISSDGGATWGPAVLGKEDFRYAWRQWSLDWKPARPGFHNVMCRATDSAGRTQPIEPFWNPSGYLWNAIEKIGVLVEG